MNVDFFFYSGAERLPCPASCLCVELVLGVFLRGTVTCKIKTTRVEMIKVYNGYKIWQTIFPIQGQEVPRLAWWWLYCVVFYTIYFGLYCN